VAHKTEKAVAHAIKDGAEKIDNGTHHAAQRVEQRAKVFNESSASATRSP
jgi:hypothetical protein